MNDKLYRLMDWAGIEAIVYSEEDHPEQLLGPHICREGVLIQTFLPSATAVTVVIRNTGKRYPMELADEAGFYAVLLGGKKVPDYYFETEEINGTSRSFDDAYRFGSPVDKGRTAAFAAGICPDIYQVLGAHPMKLDGTEGVHFAVWAPGAMRVSVVGNFNNWDGRCLPMRRLGDTGIFDLFVPGVAEGSIYKYEIKARGGLTYLKADPYAVSAELRPNTASVVASLEGYHWSDEKWMKERKGRDVTRKPVSIYEVHLPSWKTPEDGREFYSYRELAHMLAGYVSQMGFTHVQLMPVMEHPLDASLGYQVTGYYAPTSRFGTPKDFMYFVDYLHQKGIGVILDWVPGYFARDNHGLAGFDGTCLYEHLDPRQGVHPTIGTLVYNYGRPQVRNFLIANALYWKNIYHVDGIHMDGVASMLYLNYGKRDGEWVANMYGGRENLEAIDFLKQLSTTFHKDGDGAFLTAEETSGWPKLTAPVEEEGLGFDLKWNQGWMNDFLEYIQLDPIFRSYHHNNLTMSMIYAYSENYLLPFSHEEVGNSKRSLIAKMPGKRKMKFANLRAAYGFLMTHPGKKLLFMGQDFAQFGNWEESDQVEWSVLQQEEHRQMQAYVKDLLHLYRKHPALYAEDTDPEGFEWINNISANENILVFLRKDAKSREDLLVILNFSPLTYEKHKVGVPYEGKYKEIFNSDKEQYGGSGKVNARVKNSRKSECDDKEDSIIITVPPLGVSVFSCTKI